MPRLPIPPALRRMPPLHRAALLALGLLALYLALPRPAASDASALPTRSGSGGAFGPGYLLVLGLLGAGGFVALRLKKQAAPAAGPALEPLGQLALGQQGRLQLVRYGGEVLLVGVTAQQVTLLRTYDGRAASAALTPEAPAPQALDAEALGAEAPARSVSQPSVSQPSVSQPAPFARRAEALAEPSDSFEEILRALGGTPTRVAA